MRKRDGPHTYIHTYLYTVHTYDTYIHTYIHTYIDTYTHTHTHTYLWSGRTVQSEREHCSLNTGRSGHPTSLFDHATPDHKIRYKPLILVNYPLAQSLLYNRNRHLSQRTVGKKENTTMYHIIMLTLYSFTTTHVKCWKHVFFETMVPKCLCGLSDFNKFLNYSWWNNGIAPLI